METKRGRGRPLKYDRDRLIEMVLNGASRENMRSELGLAGRRLASALTQVRRLMGDAYIKPAVSPRREYDVGARILPKSSSRNRSQVLSQMFAVNAG